MMLCYMKYDRTVLKIFFLFIFLLQASITEFERLAASLAPADVFDVWLSEGDQQIKLYIVIFFLFSVCPIIKLEAGKYRLEDVRPVFIGAI